MKPLKESMAYAERMRKSFEQRRRDKSMKMKVQEMDEFYRRDRDDANEMLMRKQMAYAIAAVQSYTQAATTTWHESPEDGYRMGISGAAGLGAAVLGGMGTAGAPSAPTFTYLPTAELEYLHRELEEHKKAASQARSDLQERDEIIEALAADMEDIEKLKEENAQLRIVGCLKVKASEPEADAGGWIACDPDIGPPAPRFPDECHITTRFRSGVEATLSNEFWTWGHIEGLRGQEIVAYKIAP